MEDPITHQKTFEAIARITKDFTIWYQQMALMVAYPEGFKRDDLKHPIPSSFQEWLDAAQKDEEFSSVLLANLNQVYYEIIQEAERIMVQVSRGDKPTFEKYHNFQNLFDAFLAKLARIEHDAVLDGLGIDELTGFRNSKAAQSDFEKEMDRANRAGNSFAMVLGRLDHLNLRPDADLDIKITSAFFRDTLRSFDDTYYIGDGKFLFSLKHADLLGAQAFISRVQDFFYDQEDSLAGLSMSFSMVEPVKGDDIQQLIAQMNEDLDAHQNEGNIILEFKETSPLQRYISSID